MTTAQRADQTTISARFSAILLLVFACIAPTVAASDTVYRVVGPDGEVSYTDTPPETGKVEAVELKAINTQPALEVDHKRNQDTTPEAAIYERIEIVAPENDSTIPPGQLNVIVQLELEPQLHTGHLVQFLLDGAPQATPAATTAITLGDLHRGSRVIKAEIIDAQTGNAVATSTPVTIHVKRHSVKHNSLAPKPKAP